MYICSVATLRTTDVTLANGQRINVKLGRVKKRCATQLGRRGNFFSFFSLLSRGRDNRNS